MTTPHPEDSTEQHASEATTPPAAGADAPAAVSDEQWTFQPSPATNARFEQLVRSGRSRESFTVEQYLDDLYPPADGVPRIDVPVEVLAETLAGVLDKVPAEALPEALAGLEEWGRPRWNPRRGAAPARRDHHRGVTEAPHPGSPEQQP